MYSSARISVVIVSYHTGSALWICLYRTLQQEGVKEVIIVNNGSEGAVEQRLRQLAQENPRVRLLTGHGNIGFSRGCNLGAEEATGDYLFFLNPDAVIMERDGATRLAALFGQPLQPPVGLAGGVLRNDDGSEQRASRRNLISPQNALSEGLGLHALGGPVINVRTPLADHPMLVGAASGACIMMERERFRQIGRFDEEYFLHVEDMDLCMRVHRAGGGVWVDPQVNILHFRSTSNVRAIFVERMKTRGFQRYFSLYYHQKTVLRLLVQSAVHLKLGLKILGSFSDEFSSPRLLTDAHGMRRVQAIVRGFSAVGQDKSGAGRTVLVTGGSSQVGLFTIGRLLGQGYRVVALVHRTNIGFFHPNLAWVRASLHKPEELAQALRPFCCEAVIHCAPVWLAAAATTVLRGVGVTRAVAISSTSIIAKQTTTDKHERKFLRKLTEGEEAFKAQSNAAGLAYTILRPTLIYGAGLDQNVTRVAEDIDRTDAFYVEKPAQGRRAPVHADDVAQIAINAINAPAAAGQSYDVQGGEELPYIDMVARIGKALGKRFRIKSIPGLSTLCSMLHPLMPGMIPPASVAKRMQQDQLFPDPRIVTELGVHPRPFLRDGIIDLGKCQEDICYRLLDIYVENATYFVSSAPTIPVMDESQNPAI